MTTGVAILLLLLAGAPVAETPACPEGAAIEPIGDDVTPPEILSRWIPELPAWTDQRVVRRRDYRFRVVVTETGEVCEVVLLEKPTIEPPWPELDEAYRAAVLRFRFRPAQRDDEPLRVRVDVPMRFYPYPPRKR